MNNAIYSMSIKFFIVTSYRWHSKNTSIIHRKQQEQNHTLVVSDSFKRLSLDKFWTINSADDPTNPRKLDIIKAVDTPVNPQDILFLIPTCSAYTIKANAVRLTWAKKLKDLGFRYFFLRGDINIKHATVSSDILFVPCKDDYESLLLKLVLGYEFLYRNMNFSYVYKMDDDCLPNLKKLVDIMLPQVAGNMYIGGSTHPKGKTMNDKWHFGKCSNVKFDQPFRFNVAPFEFAKGGYGYLLRKDILPLLIDKKSLLAQELKEFIYSYEDIRVAEILLSRNIKPINLKGYELLNAKGFDKKCAVDWLLMFDITDAKYMHEANQLLVE